MLKAQGQVAKEAGNDPMEKNFERAAELVDVPDEVILKMYDKLARTVLPSWNWS